jgi:leucyl-tRNA---protein transferase
MESLFRYVSPPSECGYLPDRLWELEYEYVLSLTPTEYMQRMLQGWRRFGTMLFRPQCRTCTACRPIRVVVDHFRPNRSQRRCRQRNEGVVERRIGVPKVTPAKLELYDRFHAFQSETRGWPWHDPKDAASYHQSFVENPFPTEEWCYYLGRKLVGVGYVDALPDGLSAIYFVHDPAHRERSLGTWNVLSVLDEAHVRGLPHVYLGYYVEGCPSMEYKCRFLPNQVRHPDGSWRDFRT